MSAMISSVVVGAGLLLQFAGLPGAHPRDGPDRHGRRGWTIGRFVTGHFDSVGSPAWATATSAGLIARTYLILGRPVEEAQLAVQLLLIFDRLAAGSRAAVRRRPGPGGAR